MRVVGFDVNVKLQSTTISPHGHPMPKSVHNQLDGAFWGLRYRLYGGVDSMPSNPLEKFEFLHRFTDLTIERGVMSEQQIRDKIDEAMVAALAEKDGGDLEPGDVQLLQNQMFNKLFDDPGFRPVLRNFVQAGIL